MLCEGDDVNLRGNETVGEAFVGQSQATLAVVDAGQLLGPGDAACGPEARARATGHDDGEFFHDGYYTGMAARCLQLRSMSNSSEIVEQYRAVHRVGGWC